MEKFTFKNKTHEINYWIRIHWVPEGIRKNKEIQAVIYVIALIETEYGRKTEYLFWLVEGFLSSDFFDNPDSEKVAKELAIQFWKVIYLVLREEWIIYFFEAAKLGLFAILDCDKWHYLEFLLNHFKSMDIESCSSLLFSPLYRAWR